MPSHEILFICTGNYYRSRYAEAYFNHSAELRGLPWRAFSRGLYPHWVDDNSDLSPHTRMAMQIRGIDEGHTGDKRTELTEQDFSRAAHTIALKYTEHHPMIAERFPAQLPQVEFWEVHDVDQAAPAHALPEIESLVEALIDALWQAPDGNFLTARCSKV